MVSNEIDSIGKLDGVWRRIPRLFKMPVPIPLPLPIFF